MRDRDNYWAWWNPTTRGILVGTCSGPELYNLDRALAQFAGDSYSTMWVKDHGFFERMDRIRFDRLMDWDEKTEAEREALAPTSNDSRAEPYDLHLSNSAIRRFKMCRRSWWLSHYRELAPRKEFEDPTGVASLGSMVHLALEGYYQHQLDPVVVLNTAYDLVVAEHPLQAKDLRSEQSYAVTMVQGYLEWVAEEGIDATLEVVASEYTLSYDVKLDDGSVVRVTGKLDQLVRRLTDQALMLRDFKSVGDFSKVDLLILDEQMLTYSMLLFFAGLEGRPDGVLYNMLKRSKRTSKATPPFYMQEETRYTEVQLRNMLTRITAEARDILDVTRRLDAGEDHQTAVYPNPGDHCRWACSFKHVCPLLDDGSRAEDMITAQFERKDPWEYRTSGMMDRIKAAIAAIDEKREEANVG